MAEAGQPQIPSIPVIVDQPFLTQELEDLIALLQVHTRGVDNLGIYATKILSLQRPELRATVLELATTKKMTYVQRNLLAELGKQ